LTTPELALRMAHVSQVTETLMLIDKGHLQRSTSTCER
jgi:hypothetical protein